MFERSRRGVLLTSHGERVVPYAQSVLDIADQMEAEGQLFGAPLSGKLRVGMIATLGPYLTPHLLTPLRETYPDLELVLTEGLTDQLLNQLATGQLDLVLAALPIDHPGLRSRAVFFEPFWLAAPRSLAIGKQSSIAPDSLDGEQMILLEEGHCLSGQALSVCPSRRQTNNNRLQSTSLETLRNMVALSDKYTLLPWLAVGSTPAMPDLLNYRKLDGTTGREIAMVYRHASRDSADLDAFYHLLLRHLPDGVIPTEPV